MLYIKTIKVGGVINYIFLVQLLVMRAACSGNPTGSRRPMGLIIVIVDSVIINNFSWKNFLGWI